MLAVTSQRKRRRRAGEVLPAIPEIPVALPPRTMGTRTRGSEVTRNEARVGVTLEKRFSRLEANIDLINQTLIAIGEAAHETSASEGQPDG